MCIGWMTVGMLASVLARKQLQEAAAQHYRRRYSWVFNQGMSGTVGWCMFVQRSACLHMHRACCSAQPACHDCWARRVQVYVWGQVYMSVQVYMVWQSCCCQGSILAFEDKHAAGVLSCSPP
jgi:hypothetical protein